MIHVIKCTKRIINSKWIWYALFVICICMNDYSVYKSVSHAFCKWNKWICLTVICWRCFSLCSRYECTGFQSRTTNCYPPVLAFYHRINYHEANFVKRTLVLHRLIELIMCAHSLQIMKAVYNNFFFLSIPSHISPWGSTMCIW